MAIVTCDGNSTGAIMKRLRVPNGLRGLGFTEADLQTEAKQEAA